MKFEWKIPSAITAGVLVAVLALGATRAVGAIAAEIGTFRDWTVYAEGTGESQTCWVSSEPTSWKASRENVRRGPILLTVAIRPARGEKNVVSFYAGYPLAADQRVEVQIRSEEYEFFVADENAWPHNAAEDDRVVASFRKGRTAIVRGVSARGTKTTDTFSLLGFTAALERAAEACS